MRHTAGTVGPTTVVLALSMAMAGVSFAQPAPAASGADLEGPTDLPHAQAGIYKLDPKHVAVIARVLHRTFSYSVFRFGTVEATLDWNPSGKPGSSLTATVQTDSIETNVEGFARQLAGTLKSAQFPTATFVSRGFRPVDPTHEKVDGQFTLMGTSEPVTFDVSLVGAGPGFTSGKMGHVIGIHAETTINPHHYKLPDMFGDSIQIAVDTEFGKVP